MFYCYYGILGHDLKHYAAEKNSGSLEYQYGDFLRAVKGHGRASASQHTSPTSNTEEGTSSGPIQCLVPMVPNLMTATAAREVGPENPRNDDKDDAENPRIDTEIMHTNGVDYAGHANMKESNSMAVSSSPEIMQTLFGNVELNTSLGEELSFLKMDEGRAENKSDGVKSLVLSSNEKPTDESGPSISKPKNTWTRINRMDFGLGDLARAITLPALGKKDLRDNANWQNEEQENKRGKVVNEEGSFVYISTGVDYHPCQE